MHDIVTDILSQSSQAVSTWRDKITRALADKGNLVCDIFPSLRTLIGVQPLVEQLPPDEAQQRLLLVLTALFCSFCSHTRPLLLFFDDVQWGDELSTRTLTQFAAHPDCRYALIVGAHRQDDVGNGPSCHARPHRSLHIGCSPI